MVGVAKVVKESYPDPTSDEQQWLVVDLKPVKNLKRTLPLSEIKADAVLSQMQMIKRNRLSVTRVSADEYHRVMELTGTRP
jgi:predicted RNA-binding protein with PUA-like domain